MSLKTAYAKRELAPLLPEMDVAKRLKPYFKIKLLKLLQSQVFFNCNNKKTHTVPCYTDLYVGKSFYDFNFYLKIIT